MEWGRKPSEGSASARFSNSQYFIIHSLKTKRYNNLGVDLWVCKGIISFPFSLQQVLDFSHNRISFLFIFIIIYLYAEHHLTAQMQFLVFKVFLAGKKINLVSYGF